MKLVYGHDQKVAEWVAKRIPYMEELPRDFAAIGVADGNRPVAGMVFHDYYPDFATIQISGASTDPRWLFKFRDLLSYPFDELGCFKVWTCSPIDNKRALRASSWLGKREAVLAHHYGKKKHAVIYRLLEPEYRIKFGVKNGIRKVSVAPAAA